MNDTDFATNVEIELFRIETNQRQNLNSIDFENNFFGLISRGIYIKQIKQLLNYYDRSQIYISVLDRWEESFDAELDNIFSFLDRKSVV